MQPMDQRGFQKTRNKHKNWGKINQNLISRSLMRQMGMAGNQNIKKY